MIKVSDREAIKKKQVLNKKKIARAIEKKKLEKFVNTEQFQKFNLLPMGWEFERGFNHSEAISDYFKKTFRKYAPKKFQELPIKFTVEKDKDNNVASFGKTYGGKMHFSINEKINGNLLDKHLPKIIKKITILHEVAHALDHTDWNQIYMNKLVGEDRRMTRAYENTEGHDAGFADKFNWLVEKELGIKNWNFPKITTKKQYEKVILNHYLIQLYRKKYGYENDFWTLDKQHPVGNVIYEPAKILTFYQRFLHEAKLELEDLQKDKNVSRNIVRDNIQTNIVEHFKLLYNMRLKLDTAFFKTNPDANVFLRNFIKQVKKNIIAFKNINLKQFKKRNSKWKTTENMKKELIRQFPEHFKNYTEADWKKEDLLKNKEFMKNESFHKKYVKENLIWIKKARSVAHFEKVGIEKNPIILNAINKKR